VRIRCAPLAEQALPPAGRRVLATFDDRRVVVWQAHRPDVADAAIREQRFGGGSWRTDRVTRMRLSLPSLLARCSWGLRGGRERILAVSVSRAGFDAILRQAVPAEFEPDVYPTKAAWHLATRFANVSITWHPDRGPDGAPLERLTPRFGLRDHALAAFTERWVVGVEDWTAWVADHRARPGAALPVPVLAPYPVER